mgnify:CR=1 FL=1
MNESRIFGIFLVRRRSGQTLILHPFRPGGDVFRDPDQVVLDGRYASEPAPGEAETIRTTLHAELEKGLRRDALDRGFYPRLLLSAAIFLFLYLFLSIVIRDPVPLVDELLVGGLGAFAAWFALERRSLSSDSFARKSAALRRALDSSMFRPSRSAAYLEEILQDAETLDPDRLAEYPIAVAEGFSEEDIGELAELAAVLESRISPEDAAEARRSLAGREDLPRLIRRMSGRKKADLPILVSYLRIRALVGAGD